MAYLENIFYYPIKGLSGSTLESTHVSNTGIPNDRALAFVFEDSVPPEKIREGIEKMAWVPKSKIAVQNDWPGMAALKVKLSSEGLLNIEDPAKQNYSWDINKITDRMDVCQFMSRYLNSLFPSTSARHPLASPLVLAGQLHKNTRFPDRDREHVSILNINTLKDIESQIGVSIDIRRFRGNLIIDGLAPWEEYSHKGKDISVGEVVLTVSNFIVRCQNINVHPDLGVSDVNLLPRLKELCSEKIKQNFAIFGVLGQVKKPGHTKRGDAIIGF